MKPHGVQSFKNRHIKRKETCNLQVSVELMTGFEPVTSSLPRMRSTD